MARALAITSRDGRSLTGDAAEHPDKGRGELFVLQVEGTGKVAGRALKPLDTLIVPAGGECAVAEASADAVCMQFYMRAP